MPRYFPTAHSTLFAMVLTGVPGVYVAPVQAELALEEVIVVAQKREQGLQEVPITISVVSGATLDNFSINNATDLARSVPGLTILPVPQGLASPKIRGLGTGTGSESMDQSVGLFIDGVWSGRPRDLQAGLFDIERIEVIKGTQTSQLGKNTSLGAIQVFSRRPDPESGGYVQADYDFEFDSYLMTGVGNVATEFGDYRFSINYVNEEGYVENTLTGNDGPDREQTTVRLSGQWEFGDNTSVFASYTYDDQDVEGDQFEVNSDPLGWYSGLTGDTDTRLNNKKQSFVGTRDDGLVTDEQESHRALLELTHDISESMTFVSLSAYSEYDNERYFDQDLSAVDFLYNYQDSNYEQFSQELRLVGQAVDGRLDYLGGLYYLDSSFDRAEDAFSDFADYIPLDPPVYAASGPAAGGSRYDQDVESWSAFAHSTFHFSDDLRLTLGVRYTDESRDAVWERFRSVDVSDIVIAVDLDNGAVIPIGQTLFGTLSPVFPAAELERDEDNLDGSVNLQYDLGQSSNVYASWARGSKSGGFDTQASVPDEAEFDTEEAETTEVGIKSEFLDGAARLNAAVFFTEIDDFQSVVFVGDGFETNTIPVETKGVEVEGLWAATEKITLGLAATYADAENTDTDLAPPGNPEWTASFTIQHATELGGSYRLSSNAVVNYRDNMYSLGDETFEVPDLTLVDVRVALSPVDGDWELALMARNLTDQQEDNFGFDFPLFGTAYGTTLGSYNRPRTVHLQARYNF